MGFCTSCGAETRVGTSPCPSCGAPADQTKVKGVVTARVVETQKNEPFRTAPESVIPREGEGPERHFPTWIVVVAGVVLLVVLLGGVLLSLGGNHRDSLRSTYQTTTSPSHEVPSTSTVTTQGPIGSGPYSVLVATAIGPGPTYSSQPFGPGPPGSVAPGAQVRVICSDYGDSETAEGVTSGLWDYTDHGWIPDVTVDTGTSSSTVPACIGTVSSPRPGTSPPDPNTGPYPVVTDDPQLAVYSSASTSAGEVGTLSLGSFVNLVCHSTTTTIVQAPNRIANEGSNGEWDKIDDPVAGWVPDSFVASSSNGSVAPPC